MRQSRSVIPRAKVAPGATALRADGLWMGRVVRARESGWVEAVVEAGRIKVRCPSHIDESWLAAAVRIQPVEAAIAIPRSMPRQAILWGIFPGPEHAEVRVDLRLRGGRVVLDGEEIQLNCKRSLIVLDAQGTVRIRGRDIHSRASSVNYIRGGSIRLN